MIAVFILSLLIGVALPNFSSFIAKRRVDAIQATLINALSLARSEAIIRGEPVSVCGIPAGQTVCPVVATADWSNGWRVFVNSSSFIIRDKTLEQSPVTLSFSSGNTVQFGPLGIFTNALSNEQNFVMTDAKSSITSAVSLRTTGRLRTCSEWDSALNVCK